MPIITSLTVQANNKERCNLFIDGEFKAGLSMETVLKYRLKKGNEIDDKTLEFVLSEGETQDALTKAIDYVSKTLKTKRQVVDNLVKKGYSKEKAFVVIDKLQDMGLIDDVNYAKAFIESCGKNRGKRLIEFKLIQKGIKKEDIEKAFDSAVFNPENGVKLVAEKYMKNKEKTKENKAKAFRYLTGKGFSYEDINVALSEIFCEE